jgi:hypothetical protein
MSLADRWIRSRLGAMIERGRCRIRRLPLRFRRQRAVRIHLARVLRLVPRDLKAVLQSGYGHRSSGATPRTLIGTYWKHCCARCTR